MVFSNVRAKSEERTFEFGTIHQIALGESGRGRKMMAITCAKPDMELKANTLHENLNIGTTKSGKPRLEAKNVSTEVYVILSSAGGYTRRGDGTVQVLRSDAENVEVIARGNGADGDAGRIGTWDVVLIKIKDVNKNTVFRVRTSGGGYGTPSDLYMYRDGKFTHITADDIADYYDSIDEDIPFSYKDPSTESTFVRTDWVVL